MTTRGGRRPGSGRKKGSPNKFTAEVRVAAQVHGPAAISMLAELAGLINGKKAAQSEQARISAINSILDRAYGKATQPHTGESGEGPVSIEKLLKTIDRPPDETREEWLARRARELCTLETKH